MKLTPSQSKFTMVIAKNMIRDLRDHPDEETRKVVFQMYEHIIDNSFSNIVDTIKTSMGVDVEFTIDDLKEEFRRLLQCGDSSKVEH